MAQPAGHSNESVLPSSLEWHLEFIPACVYFHMHIIPSKSKMSQCVWFVLEVYAGSH